MTKASSWPDQHPPGSARSGQPSAAIMHPPHRMRQSLTMWRRTPERQNAGYNPLSEPPLFPCGYHRGTTAEQRALSSRHAAPARFSEVSATDTGGKVSSASAPKWRQQGKQFSVRASPPLCPGAPSSCLTSRREIANHCQMAASKMVHFACKPALTPAC
jgi:hypothetical protein